MDFDYIIGCTHLAWRVQELERMLVKYLVGIISKEECISLYEKYAQEYKEG